MFSIKIYFVQNNHQQVTRRMRYISFFFFFIIAFSCKNNQEHPDQYLKPTILEVEPPQVTFLGELPDSLQPKTTFLKNVPLPLTVSIPTKPGGTYPSKNSLNEIVRVKLLPPSIYPLDVEGLIVKDSTGRPILGLGGKSDFTTYTTDQGLALDGIQSSYVDRMGNLWFGTIGAGISKYDGKTFTNYTIAQGLANNQTNSFVEDKEGNIWIGTRTGVSIYDGHSFSNLTTQQGLIGSNVNRILIDKNGKVWMTTFAGVSKYDPVSSSFTNYTINNGLANNFARDIVEDDQGNIWIATRAGLSKYEPSSASTSNTKIFKSFTTAQGLVDNNTGAMMKDKAGNLWIATNVGVIKIDPKIYNGENKSPTGELLGITNLRAPGWIGQISRILEDKKGKIWIGKIIDGVSVYDPSNNTFNHISTTQGLASNEVYNIVEDKNGNIWIGTSSGGVSKYNGGSIINFITPQGLGLSSIFGITEDKTGNLWAGTNVGGIIKYDGQSMTSYGSAQGLGLSGDVIFSLLRDKKDNLWIGTNGSGISMLNAKTQASGQSSFTTYTTDQGLIGNSVNYSFESKDGTIWIATNTGLSCFNQDSMSFTNFTKAQGLPTDVVTYVNQDKYGNYWIATAREGISVYDPLHRKFINYSTPQGLGSKSIMNIYKDRYDNLWMGSNGEGLSRVLSKEVDNLNSSLASDKPYPLKFDNLNKNDGLPDDVVYDIISDHDGNIFIGTNLGLTVIPDSLTSKPFTEIKDKMEYYNAPNGYPIKDLNNRALYCDHNGIIWAGTGSEKTGLVRFDYASIHKTNTSPVLVLHQLRINGEPISWSDLKSKGLLTNHTDSAIAKLEESMVFGQMYSTTDRLAHYNKFGNIRFDSISKFYSIPQNLVLPNDHNNITIEFNAIETDKPQLINYQYILEGYDKEWSPIQKNTSATFGNISGGTYSFKVKAQGANRTWSEPVTYSFKVMPPWYASWWAYLSYLFLAAAGIYSFVKYRTKQLQVKHEELEEIIEHRTHEVKQRVEELSMINSVQEGLAKELDMQSIYNLVGDRLCALFPDSQTLVIRTFNQDSKNETWHYAKEKGVRQYVDPRPFNWNSKQLMQTKKPLDIKSNYVETAKKYGSTGVTAGQAPKSALFVPMMSGDTVKGSISLQNVDKENAFSDSDLRLLTTITNSMSVALENARLFDETSRLLAESKQRAIELGTVNTISKALASQLDPKDLIQKVGDQLKELFKANIVYLALLDDKKNMIDFPYQFGEVLPPIKLGQGLASKIIQTGDPLLINKDFEEKSQELGVTRLGIQSASYLGVPILVGNKRIGVLSVQSTEQENRFNQDDLRLLSTIASSVGVALNNAKLFDDVKQAKSEAEAASVLAAKANEAKSAFLSTVSHELRTPLTSVLGFAKIIKKRLEEKIFPITDTSDPKTAKTVQQISENLNVVVSEGQRLTSLINDVLDLAKIEAGKMNWNEESLSISDVAERAIAATSALFDQNSLILEKHIDEHLPSIIGDKDKLIQVMVNLISNSVKFTPSGTITIKVYQKNNEIIGSVSDTGIGIAPKDHTAVFEQFKQVGDTLTDKPKGTGLGLPICKEIVEHHGGRIWLESELGKGSTFLFSIPLKKHFTSKPILLDELVKQLKEQVSLSSFNLKDQAANILIVDDDDSIRSLLQQELSEAGYTIDEARNGKEALLKVRSSRPDLILLDIMMPEMNGFDVAAVLKNDPQTMDIPIIVLSIVQDKARGFKIGVDRYLTKPIDTNILFNEIGSLLEQGKSKKKVIVVDEDSAAVSTLTEVLKIKGYTVMESTSSEIIEKAKSNPPDIIIMNSLLSEKHKLVSALQFEKGLENVLFLVYNS
ncbi:MAG: two-component regulator propeller domain-containing protein [Saprospiraceae bacterium]